MLSHFFRKFRPQPTEPLMRVEANGQVWHLRLGVMDLIGALPDLDGWESAGLSTLIKKNHQRSIWRVALPSGTVYVKHCRANTPRSWIRELLRPPKAQLEFENALTLRSRGIGCTEPLAWGMTADQWPGDSFIITREQANAIPLDIFLEQPLSPQRRRRLAVAFGLFLAKLRRGTVFHPDAHPGNFLIEWAEAAEPQFYLLDVHAVQTTAPPPYFRVETGPLQVDFNLLLLNRWFQMRATRTDRLRFYTSYCEGLDPLLINMHALESETRRSNLAFWFSRLGRYRGNNREFRKIRGPGVRGHAVRDLPEDVLGEWIANPDAVFQRTDARILKDSPSSTVAVIKHPATSVKYVFKRFRRKSWFTGIKNRLRPSAAMRSWSYGQSLRDRGLPTARPLAVLHRIRAGLPREGYLIFEFLADAVELPFAIALATGVERWQLADTLGRLLRDVHDRGVSHRDLKAPNILIVAGRPVLIDLVGVGVGLTVTDTERIRNLARLNASFFHSSTVSRTDRLRLLRAYSSWSAQPPDDWKVFWRAIATQTLAKVEKNRQSGRVLA